MDRFTSAILIVISTIIISNAFITYETISLKESAGKVTTASGSVSICINNPAIINISDCPNNLTQGDVVSCLITASDEDNPTLTFSSEFIGEPDLFSIRTWGLISFTANQSFVGNHTVNITVDDESECETFSELYSFSVDNENDPPYLSTQIPNQELTEGEILNLFLTDFFTDPDGDVLSFSRTITTNLIVSISGNKVSITSAECGYSENILFTAKDPYNLSADSNIVRVTVNCVSDTGGTDTGSGGGGGGGGGGSSNICEPQYTCGNWEDCSSDGTQRKKCVDMMDCDNVQISYLYRECRYVEHCYNEVLDFDETGIDCGGRDCKTCPTCYDGIQNGDETGIDCGGNICEACEHCTNGIQDYDETGIDCGGEECVACPSCDDGIQNGDENGVDCGGSYCEPCTVIQKPSLVGSTTPWPAYLAGVMIILLILLLTYKFYRQKLKAFFIKLRIILAGRLPKEELLEKIIADNLIRELSILVEKYNKLGKLEQTLIFDLIAIGRVYFVKAFNVKNTIMDKELFPIIDKKKYSNNLTNILKGFFKKIELIERGEIKPKAEEFEEMIEELKEIIYLTSPWQPRKGIMHKRENVNELVGEDRVYALVHNALFALEFGEYDEALKIYIEMMKEYDNLLMVEKEHVYPDIIRLYKEILYAKKIR